MAGSGTTGHSRSIPDQQQLVLGRHSHQGSTGGALAGPAPGRSPDKDRLCGRRDCAFHRSALSTHIARAVEQSRSTYQLRHTLLARRRFTRVGRCGVGLDTERRSSELRPVYVKCFSKRGAIDTRIASRVEVLFDIGGHVSDRRYRSPQLLGRTAVLVRPFANRVGLSDVDARDRRN
jgi:hypothetical protein